ncbi:MAG: hypothetical protein PHH49_06150 [Candidatus Omnitrophica bacterium]|nr:hypothetical protein [Candidatus Omnitrophota bacterium]MDD5488522.1 hypothetical protein [Candidatus Omnitrophota bacterium]
MGLKNEKGIIIISVLIIAATLTILVGAFSMSIYRRTQIYKKFLNSQRAYYAAVSGVHYGNNQLMIQCWGGGGWIIPEEEELNLFVTDQGETVTLNYELLNNTVRVTGESEVDGVKRTIICDVDQVGGKTTEKYITRWQSVKN